MGKGARPEKGFPTDPVRALRARELLADVRQLVAAENWRAAAPRSHALVQAAPDLAEAYDLMGVIALRTGGAPVAEQCFERAVKLGPATGTRLLHWAKALSALGEAAAAEKILHRALLIRPDDPEILVDLGDAQLSLGRRDDALKSFRRVVKKAPDHRYAVHMVSALGADRRPDASYVTGLFDNYASFFDQHLTGTLGYRVPETLARMLAEIGQKIGPSLDIGCGTGLVAQSLAGRADPIDGLDLSPRMIEMSASRGLYRHLAVGDATDLLQHDAAFAGPYASIIAADVFIYIGDVSALFDAMMARLAHDGLIAFSVESSSSTDVDIRPSGRFAHSSRYIAHLAASHGLAVLDRLEQPIRTEENRPIPGVLYVLGRQ